MLTKRYYPKNAEKIPINLVPGSGATAINLGRPEFGDIADVPIPGEKFWIYFPIYDNFFVEKVVVDGEYTLSGLIGDIHRIGADAFAYDMHFNPHDYSRRVTSEDVLSEYAIADGDILRIDNRIYVSLRN